jgi:hypothetical protein
MIRTSGSQQDPLIDHANCGFANLLGAKKFGSLSTIGISVGMKIDRNSL